MTMKRNEEPKRAFGEAMERKEKASRNAYMRHTEGILSKKEGTKKQTNIDSFPKKRPKADF